MGTTRDAAGRAHSLSLRWESSRARADRGVLRKVEGVEVVGLAAERAVVVVVPAARRRGARPPVVARPLRQREVPAEQAAQRARERRVPQDLASRGEYVIKCRH